MPTAEIITIGTELLLGEINDTNTRYLARQLRDIGVDLYRSTQIGDNIERIAALIREAMQRSEVILTTGGLGPTVDDPTREAIARALGVKTVYHPELWEQILERYQRYSRPPTENNKRQAYLPETATAIENPVGTAPAFRVETEHNLILCLPGVPREMEHLTLNVVLPYLQQKYDLRGTIIKARVLHTAGAGESQVDELIGDLETFSNPTVGLLAKPGQTDVRITAKAETEAEADRMLDEMAAVITQRLGEYIYGSDDDTLESVLRRRLEARGWRLVGVESGLEGALSERLAAIGVPLEQRCGLPMPCEKTFLEQKLAELRAQAGAETGIAASLCQENGQNTLWLYLENPHGGYTETHTFGGAPGLMPIWAANHALNFLRAHLPANHS